MAREAKKSRFRPFGVCVCAKVCFVCVHQHTCPYFLYLLSLQICAFVNFGTCIHNTNLKMYDTRVCVCELGSLPLCPASFQFWPTSYCTVVLILYECAAACSGHCRSTHLLSHIHSTEGQQGA